ncbi:Eco57I restriction-modification methylase domain-containing protein [Haladaptatus sp. NG-WS-4]
MDSSRGTNRVQIVGTLDRTIRHAIELVASDVTDVTADPESAFDAALVSVFRAVITQFSRARGRDDPPFATGAEFEAERALLDDLSPEIATRVEADIVEIDYDDLSMRHLGTVYERLLDRELVVTDGDVRLTGTATRRATVGAYYTPAHVVEYAVSQALAGDEDARVLDPAMGSGHFLLRTVERLARLRDEPTEQARKTVVEEHVFGVDVDPLAVELARSAVWLETGVWANDTLQVGDALAADSPDALRENEFDAVVGNPPYVRSRNIPRETKDDLRERYDSATGAFDLYVPFVERMTELGDRVACVVPNKWTTARYGRNLRDQLLDRHRLVELLDVSAVSVFADASVYPLIVTVETDAGPTESIRLRQATSSDLRRLGDAIGTSLSRAFVDELGNRVIPVGIDRAFVPIAERLGREHDELGAHATLTEGIHTGNVREKLVVDDPGPDCEKLVGGGDVTRYGVEWSGDWVRFDPSLVGDDEYASFRERSVFERSKLLLRDISDRPVAAYDDGGLYALNTLYSVRSRARSDLPLRYLLAVVNSTAAACWFQQVYGGTHVSGGYLRFKPMFAGQLPVPSGEAKRDTLAALARRMGELGRERETIDVRLPPADGPHLGDLARPLPDSVLTETTSVRDGLRLGTVSVEESEGELVVSATARYRPSESGGETDSWGFVETEPVPALVFDGDVATGIDGNVDDVPSDGANWYDLLRWYVPRAVERDGFTERATKTISLRDRLESIRVPTLDTAGQFLDSCRRAERLDAKLARTDVAIDRLVYRAYGLSRREIEIVERLAQ